MQEEELKNIKHRCWKYGRVETVSSRGPSGGLATFWEENRFSLLGRKHTQHWILTTLKNFSNGWVLNIYNVYARSSYVEKVDFWNSLKQQSNAHREGYKIVVGDFNIILDPKEK